MELGLLVFAVVMACAAVAVAVYCGLIEINLAWRHDHRLHH